MYKVIAASILAAGLATSAFAQDANGGGGGTGQGNGGAQSGSGGTSSAQKPNSTAPITDNMKTNSTTGTPAAGMSGTSGAGTSEKCPAGTPGAGVNSAPKNDMSATNPACK